MNRFSRLAPSLALLALTLSLLACGLTAPQTPPQDSAPSNPPTEPPVSAPASNGSDPNSVVPCSQLLAPDDIKLLLNNVEPSNLSENAHTGGSICAWQYTPVNSSETHTFYLEVTFGTDAAAAWDAKRKYELSQEPSDIVVNSIDGLGDENYVWSSKATGLYVVFARQGDKTLIFRYVPQDVLYMANESGIIDMAQRLFDRY
jgi:hypothetical protein